MGEAALSQEYIYPNAEEAQAELEDIQYLCTGETDEDWKYGTD